MIRPIQLLAAVAAVAVVAISAPAVAGVTNYDFSTVSGDTTPFTLDRATFSSPGDPAAFTVGPNGSLFTTLPSTVLSSAGFIETLVISFAAPMDQISFDFATADFFDTDGNDTVTLTTNTGASVTSPVASIVGGFYPEGSLTYTGADFTSVTITASDALGPQSLVIGNLQTVPEPASLAMLAAGLGGLGFVRRRRA